VAAVAVGGVDTRAATRDEHGRSVTARLDQGGGNILVATTKGGGTVASMGAGGEK
jgi:hypothetical protein